MTLCEHCGGEAELELLEVWDSRQFMISACCEAAHEEAVWGLNNDPDWSRALLRRLGLEEMTGHRLRRVADDGGAGLVLDWQLTLDQVTFRQACSLVARHHQHCRAPVAWRFGKGVFNGPLLIGVAMVGRPVARAIDQHKVVEVTRLCIRRDIPAALGWNACSLLYGWAAREARMRGFEKIISYTRLDEDGGSLRAAGWVCEGPAGGRSWNWRGRPRLEHTPPCRRLRWSRSFARQTKPTRAPTIVPEFSCPVLPTFPTHPCEGFDGR